jgi:hypothetical protein
VALGGLAQHLGEGQAIDPGTFSVRHGATPISRARRCNKENVSESTHFSREGPAGVSPERDDQAAL